MGGGIFNDHFLDLFQCKIDSNTISQSSGSGYSAWGGAGVYNTLNGALVFDSCSFTGNRLINTQLSGGGIWNRGQMNAVINSTFCFNTNSGVATENPTSVSNCSFISNENGITASQSLDIEDCLVTHNGVGISTGGTSVIHDCEIASNSYGITTTGNAHIYDCQIHHNDNGGFTEYCPGGWFCYVIIKYLNIGSGIKHQGDSLIVERCTINNNIGGGGSGVCVLSGNALIRSCTIYRNKGDAGAAIKNYASTVLDNCLVTNNTSHQYGVFNNIGNSITTIKNTTIANNSVFTDFDGKIFCHGAHYNTTGTSFFNLVNCIVQSVYSPLFKYYTGNFGSDSISYSHTSNGFVGIGNIAGDPLFISSIPENDTLLIPSPAHYSLSACSPCINAGSDSLTTDSLDLAGSIRKYNTVDMGALELKYDSSVTALWSSNITETDAVIHWSRSVKPCETVVFINDTTTGSPDPLAGAFYQANAVFGQGSNLNGWYCLYKGMDSTVNVSGLVGGTTYRVAVFNLILDSIYDVPALMNFTTPGILPVNKYVISDTIGNGEWACYNASNSIVVAGNGASYKINSGGSVNLIAGQTIRLLPGTTVEQGGYLLAEIRPNGPWCYETKSVATADMEPGPPGTDSGENFRVKVWPNPVSGLLNVAWSGLNKTDPVMVELRNLYGSEIFMTDVSGSSNIVLSLKNLPRGMYFLRVIQGEQSVLSKIVRN
jgi:hypothetical protein